MSTKLDAQIAKLAASFADGILKAIQSASLEEILGNAAAAPAKRGPGRPRKVIAPAAPALVAKPAKGGKAVKAVKAVKVTKAAKPAKTPAGHLARRSADQIDATIARVVGALKGVKAGMRSEQLQKQLGLAKNEIVRPLSKALEDGTITKKGEKRATTYFAK